MLFCSPLQKNNEFRTKMCQLKEMHTLFEDSRVPELKNTELAVMTSLYTFLPNWRKLNVDCLFSGVLSSSFTTVPETVCVVEPISILRNFRYFRCFNSYLFHKGPYYGHIRHQLLHINIYQRFVFRFSQILVLTGFPVFRRPFLTEDVNSKRCFVIPYKSMSWRT